MSARRHLCAGGFDTLADTVPIAVIAFDFDPLLRLAETLVVRWQTIALAIVIAAALIVAGVIARRASLRPTISSSSPSGSCPAP